MNKSFMQFVRQSLALFVALGAVILFANFASAQSAWSDPTAAAPGGNVPAPLNVGSDSQTKTGSLTVGTGGPSVVISNGGVAANTFCLGTDCISSWSGGGGGGNVKVETGTITMPSPQYANRTYTGSKTFSTAFSSAPKVIVTPAVWGERTDCSNDSSFNPQWRLSVDSVTATSLTVKSQPGRGCDPSDQIYISEVSYIAIGS